MRDIIIEPSKSVNGIPFGAGRDLIRRGFGRAYTEMKKNLFSKNTMDAYENFHIYYTEDNKFDAIEIFGSIKVLIGSTVVFPGTVDKIISLLESPERNEESIISRTMSIGVTVDLDEGNKIAGILFGSEGYFG